MRKLILLLLIIVLTSCGSLQLDTSAEYDLTYDNYNYNQIHLIYQSNPRWFYDTMYIDMYGRSRYCHTHPYYTRYKKEYQRRVKRNTHSVNTRRVAPTYTHTNPRDPRTVTPTSTSSTGRRSYSIRNTTSTGNSTTHTSNNRTTQNSNNKTYSRRTINPTRTTQPTQRTPQKVTQRRSSKRQ